MPATSSSGGCDVGGDAAERGAAGLDEGGVRYPAALAQLETAVCGVDRQVAAVQQARR